jgi:hypothetical protein
LAADFADDADLTGNRGWKATKVFLSIRKTKDRFAPPFYFAKYSVQVYCDGRQLKPGGEHEMWEEFKIRLEQAQISGDIEKIVNEFLTTRVPESTVLDYKWKIDLTNASHKAKLAKWVAGLANTRGGILLLGVKEDGDTGDESPSRGAAGE